MWEVIYENQQHGIVEADNLPDLICKYPNIISAKEL